MKKLLCIILLFLFLAANVGQAQFNDSEPMFGQMLNLGHWSTDGLVFYWRGIEAGEVIDESFYRNNGTITGAVWSGGGLTFTDESSDFIQTTQTLPYDNDFTFICSGKFLSSGGNNQGFFVDWQTGGSLIQFQSNGDIRFDRDHVTTNGIWKSAVHSFPFRTTFAIASKGSETPKYYEDGIEKPFNEIQGPVGNLVSQSGETYLMNNYSSRIAVVDGTIFSVMVYNRALSVSEIQQLYINPDLPMQQEPIWLMFSPVVGGRVININWF